MFSCWTFGCLPQRIVRLELATFARALRSSVVVQARAAMSSPSAPAAREAFESSKFSIKYVRQDISLLRRQYSYQQCITSQTMRSSVHTMSIAEAVSPSRPKPVRRNPDRSCSFLHVGAMRRNLCRGRESITANTVLSSRGRYAVDQK
jgi:hypothetical protein